MNANELSKEIMNDIERDKVIAFCEDKIMYEAVKKFILFHLYQGTAEPGKPVKGNKNWALQMAFQAINPSGMPRSNDELGADLRASVKGINALESGFQELLEIKREEVPQEEVTNIAE